MLITLVEIKKILKAIDYYLNCKTVLFKLFTVLH